MATLCEQISLWRCKTKKAPLVTSRLVIMLGPSMGYPGGMTAVVRSYDTQGVFEAWPVRYMSTYEGRGALTQLRAWVPTLLRVFFLLARRQVALVHVHSAVYGSFWRKSVICALSTLFRVPFIFHLHDGRFSVFYQHGCNALAKACVRTILRRAARVVVLSQRWQDEVRRIVPTARTTIIGNPVSVQSVLLPLRCPARSVLFINWLHNEKGVLDLVRAIPIVLHTVPEATFVLAGRVVAGAGDLDGIKDLARSLHVEHAVRLPGWVDRNKRDDLLRETDVFVLPSYFEGLPVSVLEAMACGVPVVATSVGGIPDLIEDGVNGLLVAPKQPEELATAIIAILTDDALRTRLREAAHSDVRTRYSTESVIEDLRTLYQELGIDLEPIQRRKQ